MERISSVEEDMLLKYSEARAFNGGSKDCYLLWGEGVWNG